MAPVPTRRYPHRTPPNRAGWPPQSSAPSRAAPRPCEHLLRPVRHKAVSVPDLGAWRCFHRRVATATAPRLVRRPGSARPHPQWDEAGRRVLAGTVGFLRVLGGPGTGKTALLAEVAADRIRNGGGGPRPPLVPTPSRRAAAEP